MNERDSEAVAAQLIARGYSLAGSEKSADVILLNTCSVRDAAEQKALGKMATVSAQTAKQGSKKILGFLGCMAQSRGQELIQSAPKVQLVIGTQKFHRTADHLDALLKGERQTVVDTEAEAGSEASIREHLSHTDASVAAAGFKPAGVSAFVSIMQGCNQHCTFCIVPQTRGEERSRTISDIVGECEELVTRGVREVTLLGQIVTSFGRRDIPPRDGKSGFVQLLEAVHSVQGIERIRFTSPHPKGYGEDLIEAYGRLPKLCPNAHLPMQSGSDRILKAMHRGYTRERFLQIVARLRESCPEISITTDIIVGFPGESEEDFSATLSLVREAGFTNAYIFKYSPRRDTPAAAMEGQVPQEVREERNARLLELVNQIGAWLYAKEVGKVVQILVEGPSRRNSARLEGRTRTNKIVVFEGSDRHRGQLMDVRITRAGSFTLYGDPAILNLD